MVLSHSSWNDKVLGKGFQFQFNFSVIAVLLYAHTGEHFDQHYLSSFVRL